MSTPPCPACSAPGLIPSDTSLYCRYCATTFSSQDNLCPACGWINTEDAEQCSKCGEPISVIAHILSRQGKQDKPMWLQRVHSQAGDLKRREGAASKRRFEDLQEIDRQRENALKLDAERRTRDAKRLRIVGVVIILMILAFSVFWIVYQGI